MAEGRELAMQRLMRERKNIRQDHPLGFYAKPNPEGGALNMFKWTCGIVGKPNSPWFGPTYILTADFPEDYPMSPPKIKFTPPIFHPNIFESGTVCLSILNAEKGYTPALSIKEILVGVQDLLDTPNNDDPAQTKAYLMYKDQRALYWEEVKRRAATYPK